MPADISTFFRLLRSVELTAGEREDLREKISRRIQHAGVIPVAVPRQREQMGDISTLFSGMKAGNLGLTGEEKEAMRQSLHAAIARSLEEPVSAPEPLLQRLLSSAFLWMRTAPVVAVFVFLFVGVGGVFASETALPGDVLYPVKIHVNERLRTSLAWTVPEQTRWQIRLAERRLEEAEELAVSLQLDSETEQQLAVFLQTNIERVEAGLRSLEARGESEAAAEIAAAYESSLLVHDAALGVFEEAASEAVFADTDARQEQEAVMMTMGADALKRTPAARPLRAMLSSAVAARRREQGQAGSPQKRIAVEASIRAALEELASARAEVNAGASAQSSVGTAAAAESLSDAEASLRAARRNLDVGAVEEAFIEVQAGIRGAGEAKVIIRSGGKVGVHRRQRGTRENQSSPEESSSGQSAESSAQSEEATSSQSSAQSRGSSSVVSSILPVPHGPPNGVGPPR